MVVSFNVEYIPKQLVDSGDSQNFKTGILTLPSFVNANAKDEKEKVELSNYRKTLNSIKNLSNKKQQKTLKAKQLS